MASRHEAPSIIRNRRWVVYDDTRYFMIALLDLFLAFSKLLTKEKPYTTIMKDEYKIEDLMDQLRRKFHDRSQVLLQGLCF